MVVFSNFDNTTEPNTLNYSEFITQVNDDQIKTVNINGEEITGRR